MSVRYNFFSNGIKKGFRAAKNFSFFEKIIFVSYIFISLILRLFIFTAPIVAVADVNMGRIINKNETLTLGRIFSNTLRRNRYFELLTFYLVKWAVLLGVVAIINIPTAFIFIFKQYTRMQANLMPFAIAIAAVCGAISLLIVCITSIYFAPAAYVSTQGEKGYFSDIAHNSYYGVKGKGFRLFWIYVRYFLLALAILIPTVGVAVLLFIIAGMAGAIIGSVLLVMFIIISYFFGTAIYLSLQTSKYIYFESFVSLKHNFIVIKKTQTEGDEEEYEVEKEEEATESDNEELIEEEEEE